MLAEPVSIALHALNLANLGSSAKVGVLGTGPIGLALIILLKFSGISSIFATDCSEARERAALKAGASWAGNAQEEGIVSKILSRQPLGLEAVFEVSGDERAIDQAVELVKPGGRIIQIGIPIPERISLKFSRLRRKEITIINVRRQNRCLEKALELIQKKEIEVSWLISHRFSLDQAKLAMDTAADRRDGVLKAAFVL
jgi:threonine dehydrogenase-like Zn-dependent dehydrogenase